MQRRQEAWTGSGVRVLAVWEAGQSQPCVWSNPPVDIANWDAFHSRVESAIGAADASCTSCSADSCVKAKQAVGELRTLVSGFDSAVRAGTGPPSDAPQQQEHIDLHFARE